MAAAAAMLGNQVATARRIAAAHAECGGRRLSLAGGEQQQGESEDAQADQP